MKAYAKYRVYHRFRYLPRHSGVPERGQLDLVNTLPLQIQVREGVGVAHAGDGLAGSTRNTANQLTENTGMVKSTIKPAPRTESQDDERNKPTL